MSDIRGTTGSQTGSDSDELAKRHFFKGNEHYLERRFKDAADEFRTALRYKPGHPRSLFNLAMSELGMDHLAETESFLHQAIAADPEYREAHGNLILLYKRLGDYAKATHYLEQAQAKWPDDSNVIRMVEGFQREAFARQAEARRKQLTDYLVKESGLKVLNGPFAGMVLNRQTSWGDGDLAPRILGCYEEELNETLEKAITRAPSVVINVGCAEGHFSIGLARRLPNARVFAHDISAEARRLCQETATANGVADRMTIDDACTHKILRQHLAGPDRGLAVLDCEGAELYLLDPAAVPELDRCDLIVECHDFLDRTITPTLLDRFSHTHDVELVTEAGRNPNRYPLLHHMHSSDRWLVVNEGRPEFMHWLVCWSRTGDTRQQP